MGDASGVRSDHRVDVVTVHGEVVEVSEQADVGLPGTVDRGHRVRGGEQRVAVGAADRLDQHGAADASGGPGGQREVLGAELVLRLGGGAVDAVAVERVERGAAEPLADADGDVDVVAELGRPGRPRDQTAVTGRHVAGEEVEADQLHAGVLHGGDEGVDVAVGRHRLGEGPPELHRVEAGGLHRRGALEKRELGEQDRAVHLVAELVGHPHHSFRNAEFDF